MKYSHIAILLFFWCFSSQVWGQSLLEEAKAIDKEMKDRLISDIANFEKPDTTIITGHFDKAMAISFIPDAHIIGVYLQVDEDYEFTADELAMPTKSYFDYYGLPAIIVKQEKALKGQGASMRIYINGECLNGDAARGDLSLYELQQNHEKWFKKIKMLYNLAQQ